MFYVVDETQAPKLGHPHSVRFYESDDSLTQTVADFITKGLIAREPAVIVATPLHRLQFTIEIAQRGVVIEDALASGRLLLLDAEETLARLMDGDQVSWERFHTTVNGLLDELTRGNPSARVCAYGEMVDVLWRAGKADAAIQLEEMWNALQRDRSISILCAYKMDSFYNHAAGAAGVRRICQTHSDVHGHDHTGHALLAEVRRNERLNRVTSAIAAAVTREQVLETVVDKVAAAIDASSLCLFLLSDDRTVLNLVRHVGLSEAGARSLARTPLDAPISFPALDCVRSGAALWIDDQAQLLERYPHLASVVTPGRHYRIACISVVVQGEIVGAFGFTFDDAPPMDIDDRDFLQLVGRYSALALERVRLQEAERASLERTELLYKLAAAVIVAQRVDDVFEAALDAINVGLRAERSAILTYGSDPVMRFRAARGLSDQYRAAVDGHSPWTRDTRDPQPIVIADVETDASVEAYRPIFRDEGIGALAFIPLVTGQRLLGKFMLYFADPHELRPPEVDLARAIADHVAAGLARFAAVAELEDSVRFNELFTGILGHDLRNPLGAIVTAAQLAMMRNPSEKLHKPLSRILTSSARMARMIEQLLDFTHVRLGGGTPLSRQLLDLVPIVRHVVDELDDAHPDWNLSLDHTGDTIGTWDGDRLAQVFSNLIANALQHGDVTGGVQVRLDGTHRDHLRAEIENLGAVPSDVIPVLFEPLAGGRSRRPGARGLGLGLFISREIVRAHGGSIDVMTDGTRTTFVLQLPRAH